MKIDFKARIKSKAFWVGVISALVILIYNILKIAGVEPSVTNDEIMNCVQIILSILAAFGVLVDTSTPGVSDGEKNA